LQAFSVKDHSGRFLANIPINVSLAGSKPNLMKALPIFSAIAFTSEYFSHLKGSVPDDRHPKQSPSS